MPRTKKNHELEYTCLKLQVNQSITFKASKLRTRGVYQDERKFTIHLEGAFAVMAPKAGLVVDLVVSCELIHQIHSLLTCLALLGCPCKRCHLCPTDLPTNTHNFK